MEKILLLLQIIVSICLVIFILLQQRGTALGSIFGSGGGGGGEGALYGTRRGIQKKLLWVTIISGALFIILALLRLILS